MTSAVGDMILASGQLETADHVILVGYFLVMVAIGAFFYRLMQGMKDYFSGGNRIPWWLSGTSYYMSCFSVYGFVVYSALAFEYGWLAITVFWSYVPGTLLVALVFSRRWRRARIDSPVEYLEARYNATMRQLCAWEGIPVKIIDDALKLVTIGVFLSASVGLSLKQSMLWSGLIMLSYTFMGGLWAVIVTDFVQFVVMGAAVVVLFVLSLVKVGGIAAFVRHSPEGFFRPVNEEYGWVYLVSWGFLLAISMCSVHWQLIQRFCCVPDERQARKMGMMVVVLHLVTPVLMFLPAMAARQFLTGDVDPKEVYPLLCTELLPPGLLGLMIAGMFAATMSMLSSDYNACASVLTNDVYRRLFRRAAREKELVLVGRLATLLIGLISIGLALGMAEMGGKDLFRNMVKLFSVATAPVAVPMILGLLSKRLTGVSAVTGFLGGLSLGLALFFLLPDEVHLPGVDAKKENILLFGTAATSGVLMFAVSWLVPRKAAESARAQRFLERLSRSIGELDEDRLVAPSTGQSPISPFRIAGVSVACVGIIVLGVALFVSGAASRGMNGGVGLALLVLGAVMARRSGRVGAGQMGVAHED